MQVCAGAGYFARVRSAFKEFGRAKTPTSQSLRRGQVLDLSSLWAGRAKAKRRRPGAPRTLALDSHSFLEKAAPGVGVQTRRG
jgi:hypothetical protein